MGIALGILYVQVIGVFVSWEWQAAASVIISIFGYLLRLLSPESPRYLVSKDQVGSAKNALYWLKSTTNSDIVENELNELMASKADQKWKNDSSSSNSWTVLLQPHIWKPCLVPLMIHLCCAATGVTPILAYMVDIFESSGTGLDGFMCTIVLGIIGGVASLVAAIFVDHIGRRPLLIIPQLVMTLSLVATGFFFYLKRNNAGVAPVGLDWLPITSLGIFIACFSVGAAPISFMIQGEIIPPEAKGTASSLISAARWGASFVTTRFFGDILAVFGEDGVYWFFAAFCLLGAAYFQFFVPETKGKTLEEIQEIYAKK